MLFSNSISTAENPPYVGNVLVTLTDTTACVSRRPVFTSYINSRSVLTSVPCCWCVYLWLFLREAQLSFIIITPRWGINRYYCVWRGSTVYLLITVEWVHWPSHSVRLLARTRSLQLPPAWQMSSTCFRFITSADVLFVLLQFSFTILGYVYSLICVPDCVCF